jgi:hypothetical protein
MGEGAGAGLLPVSIAALNFQNCTYADRNGQQRPMIEFSDALFLVIGVASRNDGGRTAEGAARLW